MRSLICLLSLLALLSASLADTVSLHKPNGAPPLLRVQTQPTTQVQIEAASNLLNWDLLSILNASTEQIDFTDSFASPNENRFYRVTSSAPQFRSAPNFRLLDHDGHSRELHYHMMDMDISAFVLIFTANGCSSIASALPALKTLHNQYSSSKVEFWMINSKASDTRASIAAEAASLSIPWPILHDRTQITAGAYGASSSTHAVVIDREFMEIFYSGAIDPGDGSASYLAEALAHFTSDTFPSRVHLKATGCDLDLPAQLDLSYSTSIAPILQSKCVTCHSPGNVAPWAMTNHAIVKAYAPLMEYKIMSREMPPWHPDPEYGRFANDISLSLDEEQKLIAWIRAGTPRGTGPDPLENVPPPPTKWPGELGPPDMIIPCPEQSIKASGIEDYRYIFVQSGLTSNAWLRAAVVRPSNPSVVHHYIVWEGQSSQQMATGLAGYVPGAVDREFPAGTGVALNKGIWLTFNLHYTPNGTATTDQPELALWFHRTPPAKQLQTLPIVTPDVIQSLTIPPGARDHEITVSLPVFATATIYRLSPHMHMRGSRMRFDVRYPNGTTETLLSIPKYHFAWQMGYYLETPKVIPVGSTITVTGAFDNSHLNHHNPDPSVTVHWGEQSWDEMFIGYVDFTL